MAILINTPFASILEAKRTRFNARFAEARRAHARLEPEAFADLLSGIIAPIVNAVHALAPEKAEAAAEALYDLGLDLLAQEFLGPHSRHPVVVEAWRALLPRLARFIAESPRAVVGSVTNALYNLSATPGARPDEWTALLLQAAEACANAATLLKMGQVLAWRAGMAHYRLEALEICALVADKEPALACLALGLPQRAAPAVNAVIDRLRADPWLTPENALNSPVSNPQLQITARVGAFRGFGGLFLTPPLVFTSGDHFLVTDGEGVWLLTADCFGATLHRTELQPQKRKLSDDDFQADHTGAVRRGQHQRVFPELRGLTSAASTPATLAATTPLSHSVFLVALGSEK